MQGMKAPHFRSLWAIMIVAEEGSINRAAQRLPLSQPAISRTIRVLEDRLGVPLFERQHSGVTPTAFGEIFIRRARRAMDYLEMAEQILVQGGSRQPGSGPRIPFHRMVSQRHLQALIEIAECESVTFAAREIGARGR